MDSRSTAERRGRRGDVAPRDVDAERQRQAGLEQPPLAEIEHLDEPFVFVGQLTLVDQEPRRGAPDLTSSRMRSNGNVAVRERSTERHTENEESGRQTTRHGDLDVSQLVKRQRSPGNDDRPVAGTDRRAVRQERVCLLHERVGREGQRGHLELPVERPLVQHLDVLRDELELETARIDTARDERPGHERVVGICRMTDADAHEWEPRLWSHG